MSFQARGTALALCLVAVSSPVASSQVTISCCKPSVTTGWGGGGMAQCTSATNATICYGTSDGGSLKFGDDVVTWCVRYELRAGASFVSAACDPAPPGLERINPIDFDDPCCFYDPDDVTIVVFSSGTHKACLEQGCTNNLPGAPGEW
jgi:hypothetical protein